MTRRGATNGERRAVAGFSLPGDSQTLRDLVRVPSMRTPGSARFAPYYKAQWFDSRALCWRDVQKACTTPADAEALFTADKAWRVIEVTMQGRRPLPLRSAALPPAHTAG